MIIPDIANPIYTGVVRGAEDILLHNGYTLVVGNSDGEPRKEETYYRTFLAKQVDGLLLITGGSPRLPEYLWRHNSKKTPIALVNRDYLGIDADIVMADDIQGSYDAVCHLLAFGHRRIGVITGPHEHLISSKRLLGFERACLSYGVKPEKKLVREGCFDVRSGYTHTKFLLRLDDPPTALFVCNGLMTMGALEAIFESGIEFPKKLALVCFDDHGWLAAFRPRISAVSEPVYELGSLAADLLIKRMKGHVVGPACKKVLQTKLIVRDSSSVRIRQRRNGSTLNPTSNPPASRERVKNRQSSC